MPPSRAFIMEVGALTLNKRAAAEEEILGARHALTQSATVVQLKYLTCDFWRRRYLIPEFRRPRMPQGSGRGDFPTRLTTNLDSSPTSSELPPNSIVVSLRSCLHLLSSLPYRSIGITR